MTRGDRSQYGQSSRHRRRLSRDIDEVVSDELEPRRRHRQHGHRRRKRTRERHWSARRGSYASSDGSVDSSDGRPARRQRRREHSQDRSRPLHSTAALEKRPADWRKEMLSVLDEQLNAHCRSLGPSGNNKAALGSSASTGGVGDVRTADDAPGAVAAPLKSSLGCVVLHGVDLGVQPYHINSMLEQLVGLRPLSVVRPAAQLWETIRSAAIDRITAATDDGVVGSDGKPVDLRFVTPEGCRHLGLHDASAAGGIVVLELSQASDVAAVVAALNGACLNGQFITACAAAS
uniref:WGS project CAEQ00000000 data, annotated contig 1533 n=1 Tax=Trypanosoma congolense (strain IL3000) TaxID=1068625 RepID=F9W6X8_TRYCI|nr:unnamed protein product [Trypanosoma congolense IL3000]